MIDGLLIIIPKIYFLENICYKSNTFGECIWNRAKLVTKMLFIEKSLGREEKKNEILKSFYGTDLCHI